MKKTVLRKYAQLIAQTGVNVQPGQEVFITADLDQPEFVKMLVEECYKRKAKKVVVDWSYQPLQKLPLHCAAVPARIACANWCTASAYIGERL